jgi:hypothetical protein
MKMAKDMVISITNAASSSVAHRKKRYLQLMALRVAMMPGVIFLPIKMEFKVIIIGVAAISQFVAVITANTPLTPEGNPSSFISKVPEIVSKEF